MRDGIDMNLIQMTRSIMQKVAFVPSGDPSMGGGAPPMDPSMMGGMPPGGAPPMDPSMMGGMPPMPPMDPAMMGGAPGGAPPMDPAMMGGAPPMPPAPPAGAGDMEGMKQMMRDVIAEEVKKAIGGDTGNSPNGKATGKPKIDIGAKLANIELFLAKVGDALGIKFSAQDLVNTSSPEQGASPAGGAGSPAAPPAGAIPPIPGIDGIQPAGTPGAMKAGSDLETNARNVRNSLIQPSIKKAEASGQAIALPVYGANDRASLIAAARRKR